MSHIIYQTEGIILGRKDFGEADAIITIFTEKFGKINAIAQGVRYLKSKLRYSLDKFSYSRFGLIISKAFEDSIWRIVDAEEKMPLTDLLKEKERIKILSRIMKLIDRMVQGEERNDNLWQEIKRVVTALNDQKISQKDLSELEISVVLNILTVLGYLERGIRYESGKKAIAAINHALKESML
ncbi:MAG: DNA repair protein RecO [Patescibacteria group bacterium]